MSPAVVYRIFDANDKLLYVGTSVDPLRRIFNHDEKPWWVMVARIEVEHHARLIDARVAESAAIRSEGPEFNVMTPVVLAPADQTEFQRGDRIFNARTTAGLTREQLAERIGVSPDTIAEWEAGQTIAGIRDRRRLTEVLT